MSPINASPVRTDSREAATELGTIRCFGSDDSLLAQYHDHEWGVPEHDDVALLETLTLVGFQAGLSWLTVLRKRSALRDAFADFDPAAVAAMTDDDVARLLTDRTIIRNPLKIRAAVANARAVVELHEQGRTLSELMWSHAPIDHSTGRLAWSQVPTRSAESEQLAKTLKSLGFRYLGPVNTYAAMQACGLVNDHIRSCIRAS